MKAKFIYFTLSLLVACSLSACGAIKKNQDQQKTSDGAVQEDITRPPAFIKRGDELIETNPDEVISAEEWQKQQQERQ